MLVYNNPHSVGVIDLIRALTVISVKVCEKQSQLRKNMQETITVYTAMHIKQS